MRDKKYWQNSSINTVVLAEKITLDYEKDLENLYLDLSKDIEKELSLIFNKYGKNDKILYNDLRLRIDNKLYKQFKSILKYVCEELSNNIINQDIIKLAKNLYRRKTISILEYIQFMCDYYICQLSNNNLKYVYSTMNTEYLACYYVYYYYYINGTSKQIEFIPVSDSTVQKVLKNSWFDGTKTCTYLERVNISKIQLKNTITDLLPRYIAMGYSLDSCMKEIDKSINRRHGYDIATMRTTSDYICNQAIYNVMNNVELDSYVYIAILDERTTEQCRTLHDNVYKLSEAKIGINFPPLHFNCRSTVLPYFTEEQQKTFNNMNPTTRKNTIKSWLDNIVPQSHAFIKNTIYNFL